MTALRPTFGFLAICVGLACAACQERREPPGLQAGPIEQVLAPVESLEIAADVSSAETLGSRDDNLPFEPQGEKLASIAWRTWIYTDVGPQRTRYGYLRAGAVVDRRGPPIVNDGCAGGWYRINPRGFVCIGKGASLDLAHPVVGASSVRARRGAGLPYVYALSKERAPHLYFRLPSVSEMRTTEGLYHRQAQLWLASRRARDQLPLLAMLPSTPTFLEDGKRLPKPYGVEMGLRRGAHAGQADRDGGFAIANTFQWQERLFGLTTELDIIPMDRTKLVQPSGFKGIELEEGGDLPVGVTNRPWVTVYGASDGHEVRSLTALPKRSFVDLTGEAIRDGAARFLKTKDGRLVAARGLNVLSKRTSFPSVATGSRKWIDISLKHQTLVAYEGKKARYATLISSGSGGLGEPTKVPSTIRGTFMIHSKHVSSTMNGEEDKSDSFNLRDVPFVQYFHAGYALHAAYWHDDFGRWRSHGCINLSPVDAAWLFEWTDPHVPQGWHSVTNKERGTVVHIHP